MPSIFFLMSRSLQDSEGDEEPPRFDYGELYSQPAALLSTYVGLNLGSSCHCILLLRLSHLLLVFAFAGRKMKEDPGRRRKERLITMFSLAIEPIQ